MSEVSNLEKALKERITVECGGDTFIFKIPSVRDRIEIAAKGAQLRQDAAPQGSGVNLGFDPGIVVYTDTIATFMNLLKETTAKWVYSPDASNSPVMNLDNWPDDAPVAEVVNQFNIELDKFRATRN